MPRMSYGYAHRLAQIDGPEPMARPPERCQTDCEHRWHGLPCVILGCGCSSSFVDRTGSGEGGPLVLDRRRHGVTARLAGVATNP